MSNTVLPPLPRIFKGSEIKPAMQSLISQYEDLYKHILSTVTPATATFDNVIRPLAQLHNATQSTLLNAHVLDNLGPDAATRDAAAAALNLHREAEASWRGRPEIFALVQAVRDRRDEAAGLDHEDGLWAEREWREYKLCGHGAGLSAGEIEGYLAERIAIQGLVDRFYDGLGDDHGGVWLSAEELEGVPEKFVKQLGEPDGEGKVYVPFRGFGAGAVVMNASKEETRRKVFVGNEQKLPGNRALLKEIVLRRDAQARKLGYKSHMEFRLEEMAVPDVEYVGELLNKLKAGLSPRAKGTMENSRKARIDDMKKSGTWREEEDFLPPWDVPYYKNVLEKARQQKETGGQIDTKEFYPAEETMKRMLALQAELLGLKFKKVLPEDVELEGVWHEDVHVYSTWEVDDGTFVGYLFLDLYARDGKTPGCYCCAIQQGYERLDGTRQYPSAGLVMDWKHSTDAGQPTLLLHSEVVTLFHELGHAMHELVSRTKYGRFHGTALSDDVCETPSAMLENFCYLRPVIRKISCHYTSLKPEYLAQWRADNADLGTNAEPPEEIPDEVIERICEERRGQRLNQYIIQSMLAIMDWELTNPPSRDALENLDPSEVHNRLRFEMRGLDDPHGRLVGCMPYPNFPGLVGGYNAAMFSYILSAIFADDIFYSSFVEDYTDREAWRQYRKGVLEPGASSGNEITMLEGYLGRKANLDAFFSSLD